MIAERGRDGKFVINYSCLRQNDMDQDKKSGTGYGYGKRSVWQWVLIYIVIGAIVYGLIYYFAYYKSGSSGYNTNTAYPGASTTSSLGY